MTIDMKLLREQAEQLSTLHDALRAAGIGPKDVPTDALEGVVNLLEYLRDQVELPDSALRSHSGPGHACEVATYGPAGREPVNVAIECTTCGVVLLDFDTSGV